MKRFSEKYILSDQMDWEELGGGVSRKFLGYDNQIMMVYVKFEQGALGAPHSHFHTQSTFVAKGKFEFEIDGVKQIEKREMAFISNQTYYIVLFVWKKVC